MRSFDGYRRGVNLGGWLSQCLGSGEEYFSTFITEADVERIASWGLDHIRLPVDCDVIFEDLGRRPSPRMDYVDKCVQWCERHHLKLVIDLHKTYGYAFDEGHPGHIEPFFGQPEMQDAFIRMWETLARRYGDRHDRIAFELLNEVNNPAYTDMWNAIIRRTIAAIRAIAPQTYILVGGVNYNSVTSVPLLEKPYDDHVVYNFHCYEPMVFTHQRAPWVQGMPQDFYIGYPEARGKYVQARHALGMWQADSDNPDDETLIGPDFFEEIFRPAIEAAEKWDVPLYCGEFGVIDRAQVQDTVAWMKDINAVFEEYGIGRALWTYKQHNFGLIGNHYAQEWDAIIKAM